MTTFPYKEMGSQFGGCKYGHLVPGVVICTFGCLCFSSPSPQTYWTVGVVAQGTVGAQNFHNTAKIVSKINKVLYLCTCFLMRYC